MKKIFYFLLLASAIFPVIALAQAPSSPGFSFFNELMCSADTSKITGIPGSKLCTVCDLLKVVENAINYATIIVLPLGAIAIVYGGFLIMTSAGNSGRVESGRKALWAAMIGIAITLGAWLLVNTVIQLLAQGYYTSPWNEIACTSDAPPAVVNSGGVTSTPTSTLSLNAKLASKLKPLCTGSASCAGVGSCTTLTEAAADQTLTVCASGCKTSPGLCAKNPSVQLSTSMLQGLVFLKEAGMSFGITSLTTGDHSATSAHYKGMAADLVTVGGAQSYADLQKKAMTSGAILFQCEKNGAVVTCPTSPSSPLADHLHVQY